MARLGELLTTASLLAVEQVDKALRAQVVWGGRLGTNLVELGAIDLDTLSRMLGRQHGLPSAVAKHFEKSDPELQQRLPAELAARWSVVPLLYIKQQNKIAIAAQGPLPWEAIVAVSAGLSCAPDDVLVAVAAEMRILYHLERSYGIARPTRYLRSRTSSVTPFPQFDNIPVPVDSDAELAVPITVDDTEHPTGRAPAADRPVGATAPLAPDDVAALIEEATDAITARAPTEPAGRERRSYVRTLDQQPPPEPAAEREGRLARIELRRVAVLSQEGSAGPGPTLADCLRAIRRGSNRDRVAELAIAALDIHATGCEAAVLLAIRGDVAISWKQWSRAGAGGRDLAVPLDQAGLVPTAVERNATARCGVDELGAIDQLLFHSLGGSDGALVVVPIAIADRVVAVIATATAPDAETDATDAIEAVAGAAAAAFARLVRDASR